MNYVFFLIRLFLVSLLFGVVICFIQAQMIVLPSLTILTFGVLVGYDVFNRIDDYHKCPTYYDNKLRNAFNDDYSGTNLVR